MLDASTKLAAVHADAFRLECEEVLKGQMISWQSLWAGVLLSNLAALLRGVPEEAREIILEANVT